MVRTTRTHNVSNHEVYEQIQPSRWRHCLSATRSWNASYPQLQSWPKLYGTSLQNALPRPSISFSHGNQRSLGQILFSPPSPHAMLFVRKCLPTSRPTLHRGGRGERANTAAIRKIGTLSHTFLPGLSISRTFTTNAHNSKCMECTVSKFVCVKFVHVLHTSLTSRLWKNSFVAIYQRFRARQTTFMGNISNARVFWVR